MEVRVVAAAERRRACGSTPEFLALDEEDMWSIVGKRGGTLGQVMTFNSEV